VLLKGRNLLNFSRSKSGDKASNDEFVNKLRLIKEGDKLLREEFLSRYTPFMLKIAANAVGKYIDVKNSDEFSIVLSAFNEAIDSYDLTRNYNFLLFSEHVIKRRLIDYMRKNRRNKELPFSYFDDESELLERYLSPVQDRSFEDVEIREELIEYKETLEEFGINFVELILSVPKHKDSRELCLRIATILADDEELFQLLCKYKNIPRNDLKKRAGVHGRTIGRHRKYIIAVCLILRSNLEISKSYLLSKEGESCE
jgi:RNA polymerase sigma factor